MTDDHLWIVLTPPVINRGKKIFLSVMERSDIPVIYETINDRDVNRFLRDPANIFYLDGEYAWYDKLSSNPDADRVFEIREVNGGEIVGLIGLHTINWKTRTAYVGYLLRKQFWGKGYMTEAVSLVMDYAFNDMDLRKLTSSVLEPNIASQKVLEKNGFRRSGVFREVQFIRDFGYVNEIHFDILRREWEEHRGAKK